MPPLLRFEALSPKSWVQDFSSSFSSLFFRFFPLSPCLSFYLSVCLSPWDSVSFSPPSFFIFCSYVFFLLFFLSLILSYSLSLCLSVCFSPSVCLFLSLLLSLLYPSVFTLTKQEKLEMFCALCTRDSNNYQSQTHGVDKFLSSCVCGCIVLCRAT